MHRFIAIHGSAAHLALAAMSPLFLYPVFGADAAAVVLLALLPLSAIWVLMEPSVYAGEMPHNARRRVACGIAGDRFAWLLLTAVAYLLVCTVNTGVEYAYDIERREWGMSVARVACLPCSSLGFGWFPFSVSAMAALVSLAVRNSFGRQKLASFIFFGAVLSGLAGVVCLYMSAAGGQEVEINGLFFGLMLLVSTVAVTMVFEQRWGGFLPLLVIAQGGNLVGAVAFSSTLVAAVTLLLWVVMSLYALLRMRGRSVFFGGVGFPLVWFASVLTAGFLLQTLAPTVLAEGYAACSSGLFLSPDAMKSGTLVSGCAKSAWMSSPWAGRGLGTFSQVVRCNMPAGGWAVVARGGYSVGNAWMRLLAEGGIVGLSVIGGVILYLLAEWVRALSIKVRSGAWMPEPVELLGPVSLVAVIAVSFFFPRALSIGVLSAVAVSLAVSARMEESSIRRAANG